MSLVVKVQVVKTQQARVGDPSLDLPKAVKALLLELLGCETPPAPMTPPSGEAKTPVTLWLNDGEEALVRRLAESAGIGSPGVYLSALLYAALRDPATPSALPIDRATDALGLPSRDAQRLFASQISGQLFVAPAHSVLLAEAATGIGKSLGFLSVALDSLERNPHRPIIVAAPGYGILRQSFAEWRALASRLPELPDAVVVMGQQEFVSEQALHDLLNAQHDTEPRPDWVALAWQWVDAGAPAPEDSGLQQTWTQAGLRHACPAFPHAETIRLDSDTADSDAGMIAYRSQFAAAQDGPSSLRVVFCTHAMLAVEVKLRRMSAQRRFRDQHSGYTAAQAGWDAVKFDWQDLANAGRDAQGHGRNGNDSSDALPLLSYQQQNDLLGNLDHIDDTRQKPRLPENALLVVDEAHLLEEAFARTFASGESVWRLVGAARTLVQSDALSEANRRVLKNALPALLDARDGLRQLGASLQGDGVVLSRSPDRSSLDAPFVTALQRLLQSLEPFAGKHATAKKAAYDPASIAALGRIRRAVEDLKLGLRSDSATIGVGMRVSWSPDLSWPSFETGRMDVSASLDFLWNNVAERSVCVSATLLTQTGIDPAEAILRILGVRPRRGIVLPPVHPAWVTQPVEVRIPPAPERRPHEEWLNYPRRDSDGQQSALALRRWIEEIADYVAGIVIHNEAHQRGGVLLLLTSHADRMAIAEHLVGRLGSDAVVSQEPGRPLEITKNEFMARRAQGIYAVMVGVGNCWTGLDLSDRSIAPEEDRLLTDLVIARLPIGTNRTLTHLARKRRMGTHAAEMLATAITLRQGIGRLVRRQGLSGRVLHVLDGRASNPGFAYGRVMERILGIYPNRQIIRP